MTFIGVDLWRHELFWLLVDFSPVGLTFYPPGGSTTTFRTMLFSFFAQNVLVISETEEVIMSTGEELQRSLDYYQLQFLKKQLTAALLSLDDGAYSECCCPAFQLFFSFHFRPDHNLYSWGERSRKTPEDVPFNKRFTVAVLWVGGPRLSDMYCITSVGGHVIHSGSH